MSRGRGAHFSGIAAEEIAERLETRLAEIL